LKSHVRNQLRSRQPKEIGEQLQKALQIEVMDRCYIARSVDHPQPKVQVVEEFL
jgi:hypothetical protein